MPPIDEHLNTFVEMALFEDEFFRKQTRLIADFESIEESRAQAWAYLQENAGEQKGIELLRIANTQERRLIKICLKAIDTALPTIATIKQSLAQMPSVSTLQERTSDLEKVEDLLRQYSILLWKQAKIHVDEANFISSPTYEKLLELQRDRAEFLDKTNDIRSADDELAILHRVVAKTKTPLADLRAYLSAYDLRQGRALNSTITAAVSGAVLGVPAFWGAMAVGSPVGGILSAAAIMLIAGVGSYVAILRNQMLRFRGNQQSQVVNRVTDRLLYSARQQMRGNHKLLR